MRFTEFVKDRTAGVCISLGTYLLMLFFMRSYDFSRDMILLLSVIFFAGEVSRFFWEYFRRRDFYRTLRDGAEQLDKKYLISEIVDEPNFLEGKIFYEVLYRSGRSMAERVGKYRRDTEELQEYIELWVHEIKLPVASLLLMSHNDENGEKYRRQLGKIDGYIENVLYYARSKISAKDYIIKQVSLADIFRNTAVRNRGELQALGVSLIAEGLDVNVTSDEKWLEFIFSQIFSNSMKYFSGERAPELRVYAEENDECVSLHFWDNGIGIPESDMPYIFDKSYTGENGRTHSRSTGMGLYIVKNLCGRLGHKISAESVRGEYTEIIISFGKNDFVKPK